MDKKFVLNWDQNTQIKDEISIIKFVEENDNIIRDRYNEFIDDVGLKNFKNKKFYKYFNFFKGYNLWWMSLIFEKSNYKSDGPNNSIKLIAIEEIIKKNNPKKIHFVCSDLNIIGIVRTLCKKYNIILLIVKNNVQVNYNLSKNFLPNFLKVILYAISFYFYRRPLIKISKSKEILKKYDIIFFSYFNKASENNSKLKIDYSSQFGNLPDLIKDQGFTSYWMSHYVSDFDNQNPKITSSIINGTNLNENFDFHDCLDSFLSIKLIIQSIIIYFKIYLRFIFKRNIKKLFEPVGSNLSLWKVLRDDFNKSIYGVICFKNILWSLQIDKFLSELPTQKLMIYLMENQGWERALLHGWRKHGHKTIIGYQYGILRYWDLRYYTSFINKNKHEFIDFLQPNYVATSSEVAHKLFLEMGYNRNDLIKVENLRYNHLFDKNKVSMVSRKQLQQPVSDQTAQYNDRIKILILFDIDMAINKQLIQIINKIGNTKKHIEWHVKFHSGKYFAHKDMINHKVKIVNGLLINILKNYDLALTVSNSGASIDAYILQIPLIIFKSNSNIDFSPFKKFSNSVLFVNNENELREYLISFKIDQKNNIYKNNLIWHDPGLTKWKNFLIKVQNKLL